MALPHQPIDTELTPHAAHAEQSRAVNVLRWIGVVAGAGLAGDGLLTLVKAENQYDPLTLMSGAVIILEIAGGALLANKSHDALKSE